MKGVFITIEGVEGCGKTTQLGCLSRHLTETGYPVETTREPGGTPIAEAVRAMLLDPAHTAMTPTTELLLYEAARAQHVSERIRPALEAGCVVLCDRFVDSTTAYQGGGRGMAWEMLNQLHAIATDGLWPHLTILLDVLVEEGRQRAQSGRSRDRIEGESLAFHERVRQAFLQIAAQEPERVRVVEGNQPIENVRERVTALVEEFLRSHEF
ncbi:MAG: dTMP kinase [Candidatus Hydrogenedentota bacterium]